MYDKIIFENIKCCSEVEKANALASVDMILVFSRKVNCFGIFSLEDELKGIENKFLKKALQMMIDGMEPELIKQILLNYIKCMSYKPDELLERVIFLEGILAIQRGEEENVIREKLTSFLGEDFITTSEGHYGLSEERLVEKRNEYLLKTEGFIGDEEGGFGKTIIKMKERSLQRLLREIDVRTIGEAIYHSNSEITDKILKNVSVRTACNIIDELEKGAQIGTPIKEGAQDCILKTIHKLVESKDIQI